MASNWLAGFGGGATGLAQSLSDQMAREALERRQAEIERSNRADEDYRSRSLQSASEDQRLRREQATAAAAATAHRAEVDDTRAAYSRIPMKSIVDPAEYQRVTRIGALPPSAFDTDATIPDRPAVASGVPPALAQNESVIQLRGTPTEIAAERTAKATEDQREYGNHSAIYKEWQDYKQTGGTLGFDAYATMDANRKKPTTPADGADAVNMTPRGLDMMAKQYALTGNLPALGSGKAGADRRAQVVNRAADYNRDTDSFSATNPSPDLAASGADYRANSDAVKKIVANQTAVGAFANTAKKNVELLKGTLATLPDTGVQFLNRPYRQLATQFGSTNMSKFNAIQNTLKNEYARLTSQPNLTGVLSDTARHETEAALGEGATVAQILAAFEALAQEGDNRHRALDEQLATVRGQISPQHTPATTPPPVTRKRYDPATGTAR